MGFVASGVFGLGGLRPAGFGAGLVSQMLLLLYWFQWDDLAEDVAVESCWVAT